jgi:hypothetical protein
MTRLLVGLFACCYLAAAQQQPINPDAAVIQHFEKRIASYLALHKQVESTMPHLKATGSPEQIDHRQHELARGIHDARRDARQGEIFTPEISREFRRLVKLAMQSGDRDRIVQSLRSAEPVRPRIEINGYYPEKVPRQSTPPSVLLNLPKLPGEVEYRIVGNSLILLDVKANLIVDIMPELIS